MEHPPIRQQIASALKAAADRGWTEPQHFPAEVHESLRQLYAERPKRRDEIRFATPDELALADLQRNPNRCRGYSVRTGLPCRNGRVFPGEVCPIHGASMKHVQLSNERKLAALSETMIAEMVKVARLPAHNWKTAMAKQKAAADLLDRAGVGALVEAKVRQSYRNAGGDVTVQIGFLQTMEPMMETLNGAEVIDAQIAPVEERAALPAADSGTGAGDQDADDRDRDARGRVDPARAPGAGD